LSWIEGTSLGADPTSRAIPQSFQREIDCSTVVRIGLVPDEATIQVLIQIPGDLLSNELVHYNLGRTGCAMISVSFVLSLHSAPAGAEYRQMLIQISSSGSRIAL
jgi:hypothetical protein